MSNSEETPQLPEIVLPETDDHWAGITDPRERRKIQNRLAQRAYRVRNSRKGNLRIKFFRPGAGNEDPVAGNEDPAKEVPARKRTFPVMTAETDKAKVVPAGGNSPASIGALTSEFVIRNEEPEIDLQWSVVAQIFVGGVPRDHEFINLLYYNVFRAFQVNISSLGLTTYLVSLDILSPFNALSLGGTVTQELENAVLVPPPAPDLILNLPPSLQPTELQISVLHHPWIDLFPCPKLRDNLLRKGDDLDGLAICHAVCEGVEHENTGLIVWGDPWDTSGWEITEGLAKKWPWMLDGCDEVINGTNYWRSLRGLANLDLGE